MDEAKNNILYFYSTRCKHCIKLNGILKNKGLVLMNICVDFDSSINFIDNHNIAGVPSIVLENGEVLEGSGAFDWARNYTEDDNNEEEYTRSRTYENQYDIVKYAPEEYTTKEHYQPDKIPIKKSLRVKRKETPSKRKNNKIDYSKRLEKINKSTILEPIEEE
jgi:hypothetical protein